ncbi:MAG: glycoside hydrolase family 127 protein [Thermoguttaceae bacterium]|nr:glycoside hydrolase family 127 protein [Thermoguttaceae bacterium]MDW8038327.1 glycoside hydrolase family 127 protein [Thermoguttaceae bacterium]
MLARFLSRVRTVPSRKTLFCLAAIGAAIGVWVGLCQRRTAQAGEYPLQPVKWTEIALEDPIWAHRQKVCREVTLPHVLEQLRQQGSFTGFQILAGQKDLQYRAYLWADSDVYKTLEGMAYALRQEANPELAAKAAEIVRWIVQAQEPDGYLMPHLQLKEPQYVRFSEETSRTCESYSMGHLIEAAVAYQEATGKADLVQAAQKAADLLLKVHSEGKHFQVSGHPEIELALVRLYRATGQKKYLELARRLLSNARQHKTLWSGDRPFLADTVPAGHAVAACYLWAGATDAAVLSDDQTLLRQLEAKWEHLVSKKMYITGGIGHSAYHEGFAPNYELPNYKAYCETCASLALVLWSHRLFLATGQAQYMDAAERTLYNAFLAGMHRDGNKFFYVNPLASRGDQHRQAWYGCACCPTNVVRFLPVLGQYAYAVDKQAVSPTVYVCLYLAGRAKLPLADQAVEIVQKTQYPWDGRVVLEVRPEKAEEFVLALRVPGYLGPKPLPGGLYQYDQPIPSQQKDSPPKGHCSAPSVASGPASEPSALRPVVKINGQQCAEGREEAGFWKIRRTWKPGDLVELEIPMPVRRVYAAPQVETNRGRVALQRGPIVYCVESADNPGDLTSLLLPPEAKVEVEFKADLLGGLPALRAKAKRLRPDGSTEPAELKAIPYFAWDHRQPGQMLVWLAETPEADGPRQTSRWVGANYTPAYAVNQVQMWHDFRPEVVERELAAARKWFGLTTLRVFLHNINYEEEKEKFLANLERFLQIADRHGIRPGFVFFDDCHREEGIFLDRPTEPIKGYHNGRWAACPQQRHRTPEHLPKLQEYVQEVIRRYRTDARVLWWEIYNEPNMKSSYSVRLRELGYQWAKEVGPVQPILACWDDNPQTEIVDAHNYTADFAAWDHQAELNLDKGAVFTEAGSRWYAHRPSSNGEPCEVIHWLRKRQEAGRYVPGVYLCWELMVGNSNCRWYWGTPEGTPEPTLPWCGLLWPDCTPVSLAEAEAIRRWTTGKGQALFFDDFQDAPPPPVRPGWTLYGPETTAGSRVMRLEGSQKMIAGDPKWTDYLLEAVVMLHADTGNAGLVFRVNDPGPGPDQMRGYYVGFDTKWLYLGKMQNRWQELARFDLSKLECRVAPGVWNQIRIAAEGPKIRVWFNRMHPSADPQAGLRLEVVDEKSPVLSGAVGLRTYQTAASFDNVIVLPLDALPGPNAK